MLIALQNGKKRRVLTCISVLVIIAVMVLFMGVSAAPLSTKESRLKTGELEDTLMSVSGSETEIVTNNSVNRFEFKQLVAEVDGKLEEERQATILNGDAAEAIVLTNVFYTAADFAALGLPMVKAFEGANLYADASTGSLVVHTFDGTDSVSVLYACEGSDFYYVEYNGTYRGYMEESGLELSILSDAQIKKATLINRLRFGAVSSEKVTLWAEPTESAAEVGQIEADYVMTVLGLQDEWLEVYAGGAEGYVPMEEVTPVRLLTAEVDSEGYIKSIRAELERVAAEEAAAAAAAEEEAARIAAEEAAAEEEAAREAAQSASSHTPSGAGSTPSSIGAAMADLALSFRGTPYVYGGASPYGFDCSGLVYYCAMQYGFSIPRTADAQYYASGTHVSYSELAYGDLVFFSADWSYDIEHVGIYIGGGQFVHAPSTGDVVKISSITDYYSRNYYGALRLG